MGGGGLISRLMGTAVPHLVRVVFKAIRQPSNVAHIKLEFYFSDM